MRERDFDELMKRVRQLDVEDPETIDTLVWEAAEAWEESNPHRLDSIKDRVEALERESREIRSQERAGWELDRENIEEKSDEWGDDEL